MLSALDDATKGITKPRRQNRDAMFPSGLSPPAAEVVCGPVRSPPERQAWARPAFAAADPGTKKTRGTGKAALEAWK